MGPESTKLDSALVAPLSTITIPVHYEMEKLQELINNKIQGTFMKSMLPLSSAGDSLYIEITKSGLIQLSGKVPALYFKVPLHISGRINKKIMGLRFKNQEKIDMELILHLSSSVDLGKNWELVTNTKLEKIEWKKDPEFQIAFVKVNLKNTIGGIIEKNKDTLSSIVDEGIRKGIDTHKAIYGIWMDIQKPIRINKKEFNMWLKMRGESLTARFINTADNVITLEAQMTASVKTLIDGDSIPASNHKLPPLKKLVGDSQQTHLFVHVTIPFAKANELINKKLKGVKLSAEGYSAEITKTKIYGTDHGLAVQLDVKGDAKGTFYMQGIPYFTTDSNKLGIKDFDFDIDTENSLVGMADWIMHSDALDEVAQYLQVSLDSQVTNLPTLIELSIEKGKSGDKMNTHIEHFKVKSYTQLITKSDLQFILEATGKIQIELEQKVFMKNNRKLRIRTKKGDKQK